MSVSFVLEALVVLGSIVMGTRAGGVGVGLWGGLGTFVLVFIFGEAPGEPPAAARAASIRSRAAWVWALASPSPATVPSGCQPLMPER